MRLPVLLALWLAAPSVALAAKAKPDDSEGTAESDPKALLVFGPADPSDLGPAAEQALRERTDKAMGFPSRTMKVQDFVGDARFRLGGSAVAQPCATPPTTTLIPDTVPSEIAWLAQQANAKLNDLDHQGAVELFLQAHGRLACMDVYVDQDTYWEVHFYAGIAAFYTGDSAASRGYFRAAAAIAPDRQWDASYPPEPQSTFLSAVQDVISRPRGKVYGDLRSTNYREVWLDGRPLDLTKPFESDVLPGRHLVQAVDPDGKWASWLYDVKEGATLTFFSAVGMEDLVLLGPDGVLRAPAATFLSKRMRDEGLDELYVVVLAKGGTSVTRVFQFTRKTEAWTRMEKDSAGLVTRKTVGGKEEELTPQEKNRRAFLREPDYRSSVSVGFKYLDIHRCGPRQTQPETQRCVEGWKPKSSYIGGLIGIDVNLYRGLNLDFRFGATVTDFRTGGTLLPEFGAGVRYRFLQGVFQPFLGVGADILFGTTRESEFAKDKVAVYGGLSGYGGLEFEMPDGFRLSLEGGGGIILGGEGRSLKWPMGHGMLAIGRFLP